MFETLSLLPLSFWLASTALVSFCLHAWLHAPSPLRVPMLAVYFTLAVWYLGDAFYNDYTDYIAEMGGASLNKAWWEVLLFVCAFGLMAAPVYRQVNRRYLGRSGVLLGLVQNGGIQSARFQDQFDLIYSLLLRLWLVLTAIGLYRVGFDFQGLFAPYLGYKADPWMRGRLGGGFDSLLGLAGYLQIGLAAAFGVIAALSMRARTLGGALIICALTLPGYIFDRTRSAMLATLLPGFLAFAFLRIRVSLWMRLVILCAGFLALESWLKFVITNRSETSISAAIYQEPGSPESSPSQTKHLGLNMFEELGFINTYIDDGTYHPNWGERYFAELVNPIPRVLWPGKPMIGIDYAVARGLTWDDADSSEAGVGGTVSTGMIGQGVVNFGSILGPIAAAFLMALWVAILARQDILGMETGRIFLYAIGLVLTFNMGRDITLLVIYPFCFVYLLLLAFEMRHRKDKERPLPSAMTAPASPQPRPRTRRRRN